MAQGNITLTANTSGGNDGTRQLGPSGSTRMLLNAISAETIVVLTVGTNTISIPTGATNAVIIPATNTGSTTNVAYSGTLALGAQPISSTYTTYLPWDIAANGSTTIVLTASAVGTISVWFA